MATLRMTSRYRGEGKTWADWSLFDIPFPVRIWNSGGSNRCQRPIEITPNASQKMREASPCV
jgi:hypothetical protein